jgi:hypothetical protein
MLFLSRSEFSRLRFEHRPPSRATSQPFGNRQDSFESRGSTPPKSLRALRRLQSIPATPCSARLAPHLTLTPAYRSGFATPSGFRTPSTPSSEIYLPALFHTGAIHGLPCLRRFLPIRSPSDLSAPGVLRAVTFGTRSCSHLAVRTVAASSGPASRMSASDGCVVVASRV